VTKPDQLYGEAALEALGRNFATVFREMVAGGMERSEALEVLKEWVRVSAQPRDQSK
jgi:hypothetical protein